MGPLFDTLALQILALVASTYGGLWLIGASVVLRLSLAMDPARPQLGIWHSRAFVLIGILILVFGLIPLTRTIMA